MSVVWERVRASRVRLLLASQHAAERALHARKKNTAPRDVETADERGAGARRHEADHHVDARGLARAVGPQEAKDLALADRERELAHGELFWFCLFVWRGVVEK